MGRVIIWGLVLLIGAAGAGFFYAAREAHTAEPRLEEALAAAARLNAEGLGWATLTPRQQDILLAVEDPGFFRHPGLDPITAGVGPTTITQDLADRLLPGDAPQILRGFRRAALALEIHRAMSKTDQLTLFLNTTGLGAKNGQWITGYHAAARAFFDTPLPELGEPQFINLVARPLDPSFYSRAEGADALLARTGRIARLVNGRCAARTPWDVEYAGCR